VRLSDIAPICSKGWAAYITNELDSEKKKWRRGGYGSRSKSAEGIEVIKTKKWKVGTDVYNTIQWWEEFPNRNRGTPRLDLDWGRECECETYLTTPTASTSVNIPFLMILSKSSSDGELGWEVVFLPGFEPFVE
jgi:hypothetical protein